MSGPNGPSPAVWNCLIRDGQWQQIDLRMSGLIEQAFVSGADRCDNIQVDDDGDVYRVHLPSFSMICADTGHGMILTRISQLTSRPTEIWECYDGYDWVEYGWDECDFLRIAKGAGYLKIVLHMMDLNMSYMIDFVSMTQQNVRTGYRRRIRNANSVTTSATSSTTPLMVPLAEFRNNSIRQALLDAEKGSAPDEEECAICMDVFETEGDNCSVRLRGCGTHFYHAKCIQQQLHLNGKCAVCNKHYVIMEGNQPKNGTMSYVVYPAGQMPLSGVPPNIGTICITYHFPSGIQGPEHPNPGTSYSGTTRHAFLPDNVQGRELLELFERAFKQRLTFQVGRSVTTGMDNCVVWNGIHHKTSTSGGPASFGWPDPTYFERVKEELKAKGIVP